MAELNVGGHYWPAVAAGWALEVVAVSAKWRGMACATRRSRAGVLPVAELGELGDGEMTGALTYCASIRLERSERGRVIGTTERKQEKQIAVRASISSFGERHQQRGVPFL